MTSTQARRLWAAMESGEWGPLPHDAFVKRAQLRRVRLAGAAAILLDECQAQYHYCFVVYKYNRMYGFVC